MGRLTDLMVMMELYVFFEERKKIELDVIGKLPIDKHIIENPDYNWNDVFSKVMEILSAQGGMNYA